MLFQRRLLRELLRNASFVFVLLTIILLLGMAAAAMRHSEGLSVASIALLVPAMTAAQVSVTLPLAVLVAVVLTYGRAAADNEIDALRCSGVHPLQIGLPGLVFGALTGLLLLLCMDYARPWAEVSKRHIAEVVDFAALLRAKLSSGEPVQVDNNTILTADSISHDGRVLGVRVQISNESHEVEREIVADSGDIGVQKDPPQIKLTLHNFRTVKGPRSEGQEFEVIRPLPRDATALDVDDLTTPQILAEVRHGGPFMGFTLQDAKLEVAMRLSAAAACLLFVLLGMPIALIFRSGDRTGAFLAAFLIALFLYFPSLKLSLYLAERHVLTPAVASWSGSAALLLVGLLLCRRAMLR
jgi:lipopolysaccharide export system permease protein